MDIFNFSRREQLILAMVAIVGVVLYMEIQRNRCTCKDHFIGTVEPTFYRSVTGLPSIDGDIFSGNTHAMASAKSDAQMATRTCLFEGEKCNCCDGMSCVNGSCQVPQ